MPWFGEDRATSTAINDDAVVPKMDLAGPQVTALAERFVDQAGRRVVALTGPCGLLTGFVLVEQHDEWQVGDRCYLSGQSVAPIGAGIEAQEVVTLELIAS